MKLLFKISALSTLFFGFGFVQAQVTTFDYTGDVQTYTVPLGVTSLQIEAFGAQGGGTVGGSGGRALATVPVTPGDVLEVYVGEKPLVQLGPGGFNGGGPVNATPCGGSSDGWPGGGASDVRLSPSLDDRLIVAGGGGGQGYSTGLGGIGGGLEGADGEESWIDNTNGKGGTQVVGGAGGDYDPYVGPAAGSGTFGIGGRSGPEDTYCTGGGGGGGWYGGGGGFVSAGAGGSSYIGYPGTTDEVTEAGVRTGNGQVIITLLCDPLSVTVSDDVICLGESITLDAEGLGDIEWDGGVINGEPFTPEEAGTFTFIATSDADGDCGYGVEITVNALPEVTASVDISELCIGDTIILTGEGADTYEWFPEEIEDGVVYVPAVGEHIYTVVGTDEETGCENEAEVEVVVFDLPTVGATITDDEICLGESVTLNGTGATTYVWEPGEEDGVAFTPDETGTTNYSLEGTDDNGCVNYAAIELTVYEAIEITYTTTDEIYGDDGTIEITVTGCTPPYTYDWDNDGTGDFDDTEDLTGLEAGTYIVEVMCDAGCAATETITVNSQVGIEELNGLNIAVYPNPATDIVTILFEGNFTYEVSGISGDVIFNGTGFNSEEINIASLANGIYVVTIKVEDKSTFVKLVKE